MGTPAAVLFDLDGTLIDSITLIVESARHAFSRCDLPSPSDAEWLADLGLPLQAMFTRFAAAERVPDLIVGYREYQMAHHDKLVASYGEIPETLRALRGMGLRLAVVTSKSDHLAKRGLLLTSLEQYFDTIVGLDSCTRHKPDPEPVLVALERLRIVPERALFVGDSPHDMSAGRAAGTRTGAALWGPFSRAQLEASRPDFFFAGPREVVEGVRGMI
jgi:pyrophosphatase PpaX